MKSRGIHKHYMGITFHFTRDAIRSYNHAITPAVYYRGTLSLWRQQISIYTAVLASTIGRHDSILWLDSMAR